MSPAFYSTGPSIMAAMLIGAPPWSMRFAGLQFGAFGQIVCWALLCMGIFLLSAAISASWELGRYWVLECVIITSIGTTIGLLGWQRAGNTPLFWANSILLCLLIGTALIRILIKSHH